MTVIAIVPWIVMLAGTVLYLIATRAEVKEMGRLSFAVGLFFVLASLATAVVRIG